jgi:glycosyltransferase involved in cell wall biosynthesis
VLISLVICTRNRSPRLSATLQTLLKLQNPGSWELVVVDNGSTDGSSRAVERFSQELAVDLTLVSEPIRGAGRARNSGWRRARGEIVAFTDDDCYPAEDFLISVVKCFAHDPNLGFIGGRVLLFDPMDHPITTQEESRHLEFRPGEFILPGLIHGANFAFRRSALESVGGFDDRFGPGSRFYCEDLDILARVSAQGWRGVYCPQPVVFHHHGRRTDAEVSLLWKKYDRGRGAFLAKCLLDRKLRWVYLRNWNWGLRYSSWGATFRELSAGADFLARAAVARLRNGG